MTRDTDDAHETNSIVESADIAACALKLPAPVRLGDAVYTTRDYVAFRLTDQDGIEGFSFGYSRGTPLAETLERIAGAIVGTVPAQREATRQRILAASPAVRPLLIRAISLADIALWDLAAKRAATSLSSLLGAARQRVPAMPVAGYFRDVRGDDAVIHEIKDLEARGFRQIKLMVGALDSPKALSFLRRALAELNPTTRIAVDAHYTMNGTGQAIRTARALEDIGVSLLEDPFIPTEWRKLRHLSRSTSIDLAAGEDVVDPAQYLDLLESVSVLRVDPTTCGGIRASLSGIESATARGIDVIPHVFTALAAQLAGAYPGISYVEHISEESGSDPIDRYFDKPIEFHSGEVIIDQRAGVGIHLEWAHLERDSTAVSRIVRQ